MPERSVPAADDGTTFEARQLGVSPFAAGCGVFGDQAVVAAMIDRIVHHAYVLTPKGATEKQAEKALRRLTAEVRSNALRGPKASDSLGDVSSS